eukprot:scaffold72310_cov24-Prasinocladus_malaysianus.AAC.1
MSPLGPVKRGDGVVFDAGDPMQREQGGAIMAVLQNASTLSHGALPHTPCDKAESAMKSYCQLLCYLPQLFAN